MTEPLQPAFSLQIPPGEDRERRVCDRCGFIDYVNPKIVVGAVVAWNPSLPGAKSEDTVLVQPDGRLDVVTLDPRWPTTIVGSRSRPEVWGR